MIEAVMAVPSAGAAAFGADFAATAGVTALVATAGAAAGAGACTTGASALWLAIAPAPLDCGGSAVPMVSFMSPISTCRKSQLDPFRLSISRVTASTSAESSTPVMFFTLFLQQEGSVSFDSGGGRAIAHEHRCVAALDANVANPGSLFELFDQ